MFHKDKPIGKTYSTVSESSTVDELNFWADKNVNPKFLEPGTIVAIPVNSDVCFAIIQSVKENMDYNHALEAYASHNFGDSTHETRTERFSCVTVKAKILNWASGEVKPVSGERTVYLADSNGVKYAFGVPIKGVPVGLFTTPAGKLTTQSTIIRLPDEYLFGKEAQGINIGGQTGYAKTNLALNICLTSLHELDDLCVVGINVKGEDLLWLDKINPELTSDDWELWKLLGVTDLNWLNFELFAPAGTSLRNDGFAKSFKISWEDVKYELNLLFSESKEDENARNLVTHLAALNINSFEKALEKLYEWEELADRGGRVPGGHHSATIKKVIRKLKSLMNKNFINPNWQKKSFPNLIEIIKPKSFITFDLNDALISSSAQKIIFQKIITQLKLLLEDNTLQEKTGVRRVLVFVDELSKYAHKSLSSGSFLVGIKSGLKNIAERGRFAGLSLLGVEQYPSHIDDSILENMSTRLFTRLKSKELSNEVYKYYAKDFLKAVTRLNKGVALLDHDTFPEPLFIKFPRTLVANTNDNKVNIKDIPFGVA